MDHVRELQGRLFAVAIAFVVFSAAAYPFFDKIVNYLLAPLGKDHELVYLTPGGAFSFIIQVCMYIGFVVALPVIMYNVYKFIMPIMNKKTSKMSVIYTASSFVLAVAGMLFAYYVSLPAALYFLTSFNLYHINPMLTIDSYFSFIMTYMLVGALLFQIPLLMLLINGATPLQPKKLMKHQDKIILGSFIVAAVVSPTPDALNQTLLASPMVVMYQLGIILVWLKNRKKQAALRLSQAIETEASVIDELVKEPLALERPAVRPVSSEVIVQAGPKSERPLAVPATIAPIQPMAAVRTTGRSIDGFGPRNAVPKRPLPQLQRSVHAVAERQLASTHDAGLRTQRRSIDGFLVTT